MVLVHFATNNNGHHHHNHSYHHRHNNNNVINRCDYEILVLKEPCKSKSKLWILSQRLTRSLSTPRKCSICVRMVYFKAIRCKQCGKVMHESCSISVNHWCQRIENRRNSYQPSDSETLGEEEEEEGEKQKNRRYLLSTPGTEGCTSSSRSSTLAEQEQLRMKIERDNNWRFMSLPETDSESGFYNSFNCSNANTSATTTTTTTTSTTSSTTTSTNHNQFLSANGFMKVANWLSQRRRNSKELISKANAEDKHAKSRFGLLDEKVAQKQLKSLIKNAQKKASSNSLIGGSGGGSRKQSVSSTSSSQRRFSSSSSTSPSPQHLHRSSQHHQEQRQYHHRDALSMIRDGGAKTGASGNSIPKPVCKLDVIKKPKRASLSGPPVDNHNHHHHQLLHFHTQKKQQQQLPSVPTLQLSRNRFLVEDERFPRRHHLVTKAKTLSFESKAQGNERLIATWPQSHQEAAAWDELHEDSDSVFLSPVRSPNLEGKEDIQEWCIPYEDLVLKEVVKRGHHGDIYRGEWHGEVLIYKFQDCGTDAEITCFWKDVAQFCKIRHENIMLFMGACVELPHLAVITSAKKGPSIYEHIHERQQSISFPNKVNIARQIAQGMGYLHARGVVHKRLCSSNIILENKVKICLMDQCEAIGDHFNSCEYSVLPKGHLSYWSPEAMKSLCLRPPALLPKAELTQESDVYAFGTILYELFSSKYPYSSHDSHSIIWLIGSGHHERLESVNCTSMLKNIISCCWKTKPDQRPSFSYILKNLQENVSLNKRHSSSEPERLNKTGLSLKSNANICS